MEKFFHIVALITYGKKKQSVLKSFALFPSLNTKAILSPRIKGTIVKITSSKSNYFSLQQKSNLKIS